MRCDEMWCDVMCCDYSVDAGGAHDYIVGQEVEERLDHEKAGDHVRLRCSPMTLQEHDNAHGHGHDCQSKAEPEVVR